MLQLHWGDNLFVYDVHNNNTRIKIAELDYNFNAKKKTFSSTGSHSLLIHFSTDHQNVWDGFSALVHHIPNNTTCADILDKTELILTNAIDCTNLMITTSSVTSTIDITFEYFEVYYDFTSSEYGCAVFVFW